MCLFESFFPHSVALGEVCSHCRRFCGTLRSALSKLLSAAEAGDVEDHVDAELISELERGRFRLRGRVVCPDCDAVPLDVYVNIILSLFAIARLT